MKERTIQNKILIALSKEYAGRSIWWTNDTGVAKSMDGKRTISFGLKGSPDILGCLGGRFIGIEVKTESGKQREAQAKFQKAFERAGGVYIIARSVEDALSAVRTIASA
ncbi:VRR-NUC domain-containing protein [Paracoccus beibuensis]|uniref:VRR-NUC domain-containing protein n=1 Tax=Paracoccus beibuensis TaxID=547602 RepID=UPI00223F4BD3|nr:VRR-NUC domain-containing protein [Paracoccus beibuensis]